MDNHLTIAELDSLAQEPTADLGEVAVRMPKLRGPVLQWFRDALLDDKKKWFVARLLTAKSDVAQPLVEDLIRAAMRKLNPSFNRTFVRPLAGNLSWPDAVSLMLKIANAGTCIERAGVGRASYWMAIELGATSAEATVRLNSWMMAEFVRSDDVVTQRCLIAGLRFAPEALDPQTRPLLDEAIEKARTSPDAYVRHRIAIQLGESSGPFLALDTRPQKENE